MRGKKQNVRLWAVIFWLIVWQLAAMRDILRAAETKIVILSTHEELPIPVPCLIIEL